MKRLLAAAALCTIQLCAFQAKAQSPIKRQAWVDSVFATLTPDERIAQLMVIRTSGMDAQGRPEFYHAAVDSLVRQYNVGAVCLFQGGPNDQAALLNRIQGMAKTPIMVTVDAEWGLGMRFAGVQSFPYQLTLGALPDATLVYETGMAMARQCRRMNIHVNYAPVVDINNNPANPVIGVRSFGEDKYKVALMGTRIMEGMQDLGVMTCAKHFPGHGDVSVDSHYDLPVIEKSRAQLDSLELYPFREIFRKGVGSVMVAHLYIPAIDNTANRATSLSPANVTGLLRNELGYTGLTFTDALEMKGVAKFYPSGEAAIQSILAGNDMLCLPANVPRTILEINAAIASGRLTREAVDNKCRRVLEAKYDYVFGKTGPVSTDGLLTDLNAEIPEIRRKVAAQAFTVLQQDKRFEPGESKGTYLMISDTLDADFSNSLQAAGWQVLQVSGKKAIAKDRRDALLQQLRKASNVTVGLHSLGRSPARRFGLDSTAIALLNAISRQEPHAAVVVFGNPYALGVFDATEYGTVAVAYEDDAIFRQAGADWLAGRLKPVGKLPVTVGRFTYGSGLTAINQLPQIKPRKVGMKAQVLKRIDAVAEEGIREKAYPGCVVGVVRHGKLAYLQAFGHTRYDQQQAMTTEAIFDLASVTKTSATTLAVMKLWEEGKLNLQAPIGSYLPRLKGSDKETLTVENLLLHQAGMVAWIPFFKEASDAAGKPLPAFFSEYRHDDYAVPVTERLYMRSDYVDTMYRRIAQSPLVKDSLGYVYSDNDFILLADIVKAISGQRIDAYMQQHFYAPMQLQGIGYRPYERFTMPRLVPTEQEAGFRRQLIQGYVHDPGAAMFGNVAGHAGLFATVHDLAQLYQMLLLGGSYNGSHYLKPETIRYFTAYHSPISRRGLGWDKPSRNNAVLPAQRTYPAQFVSPATFGHTGFTGTCVWADPEEDLVYIFLSNRVHPEGGSNGKLSSLNIRSRIHDIIYESIRH